MARYAFASKSVPRLASMFCEKCKRDVVAKFSKCPDCGEVIELLGDKRFKAFRRHMARIRLNGDQRFSAHKAVIPKDEFMALLRAKRAQRLKDRLEVLQSALTVARTRKTYRRLDQPKVR